MTKISVQPSTFTVAIHAKKSIRLQDADDEPNLLRIVSARASALRSFFEHASDCFILLSTSGTILDVNRKALEVFGASRKELLGKYFTGIGTLPNDDSQRHMRDFSKILAGNNKVVCISIKNRAGQELILECSPSIVRTGNKAVAVMYVARDVTERKKAEEKLRESEKKFRTLAEESPNMIFVNAGGRIVYANGKCEELMGYRKDEFYSPGFDFRTLIAPKYRSIVKRSFATHITGREYHPYEYAVLTKEGRWMDALLSTKLITYEGKQAILGTVLDITERKKMEAELRRYAGNLENLVEERTRKLKQVERLAAIGELATMVGHDLRNPLASMAYASYNLRTGCASKLDEDGLRMLRVIEEDIGRSNKIINDLLDYSAEIRLDLEITDIKSMLSGTYPYLKVPANIKLVDSTTEKPKIKVDFLKMQKVFLNMLRNAIDAMPEGGILTIKSRESKGKVELAISDTGTGMSKETLKRLWTPLFTTKAKGMGFGLAISKRLIEAHGGNVTVQSQIGKGTTFAISIPTEQQKDALKS